MNSDDFPLWHFSLRVYQTPAIEPLCLTLQNGAGANIPLVLFYLWLDHRKVSLTESAQNEARQLADIWQRELIQPLRSARRWMKATLTLDEFEQQLREQIKSLELSAEKQLLWRLQEKAETTTDHHNARHYLAGYLGQLPMDTDARRRALLQLATAARQAQ